MNFKRRKKRDRLTGDIDSHEWRRAARDRRVAKQPQVYESLTTTACPVRVVTPGTFAGDYVEGLLNDAAALDWFDAV